MLTNYFEKVSNLLQLVLEKEKAQLQLAAEKVADSIENDGIIQLFGCGHSHILTEEVFYRAGGLVPLKPILFEPLMLHEGAMHSSQLERKNDYAQNFIEEYEIKPNDIVFVLSTSILSENTIKGSLENKNPRCLNIFSSSSTPNFFAFSSANFII